MVLVKPEQGRAQITDLGTAVRIIIPSKKTWYSILASIFTGFWLFLWLLGGIAMIFKLVFDFGSKDTPFIFFGFIMWIIFGVLASWQFLWPLVGEEDVLINIEIIRIYTHAWILGWVKEYTLTDLSYFRAKEGGYGMFSSMNPQGPFTASNGTIKFNIKTRTIGFGQNLDEPEASYILHLLKNKGFITEEMLKPPKKLVPNW
ncbi:MAG: hypothetical protein ACM3PP_04975 [Candidatus Saccharibacteria bacterium]